MGHSWAIKSLDCREFACRQPDNIQCAYSGEGWQRKEEGERVSRWGERRENREIIKAVHTYLEIIENHSKSSLITNSGITIVNFLEEYTYTYVFFYILIGSYC